jgi:UDP-N-acetylglucosamine diphosphorylase/glucosamine-1-phosphate N-acetyltransferase
MSTSSALIMAAGMGKRMNSDLPKVLHPIGGRPMVCAVIDACRAAGCQRIVLIVGHKHELVREAIAREYGQGNNIEFAVQQPQHGTGHAVRCAEHLFSKEKLAAGNALFVLAGDGPLIRAETLRDLLTRHRTAGASATLATSVIPDPTGYGRIVRNNGKFAAIVEHKDATPEQRAINEVNPSYYCFDAKALFAALEQVQRNPASGEYYITDVPALLLNQGKVVEVIASVPPEDVLSINTPEQLAEVDAIYRRRSPGSKPSHSSLITSHSGSRP